MIRSGMVQFHDALEPLLAPIDNCQPHPDNYNNGDVEEIGASMETNGMYRPVFVQKSTGYIIAGNHTWVTCKEYDATVIPQVVLDVDDMTAHRIMVADNKIAALARPDNGLLLQILEKIHEDDSLYGTGFKESELEVLRQLAEIPLESDDFAQWPTICVTVPPHVRSAYFDMTEAAVGDRERFELLLRLAGWNGKKK